MKEKEPVRHNYILGQGINPLIEGNLPDLFAEQIEVKKKSVVKRLIEVFSTHRVAPKLTEYPLPKEVEEGLVEGWKK